MTEKIKRLHRQKGIEYVLNIAAFSVSALTILFFFASAVFAAPYREGELLVRFKKGVGREAASRAHAKAGATIRGKFRGLNVEHISLGPGLTVREALDSYKANPDVEHAEPNYFLSAAIQPNDPVFGNQWGLHNTGQTVNGSSGIFDADIDAPEAWNIINGTSSIVVAIIDTGLDLSHVDLSSNVWVNGGETCNDSIDNDFNGYVDDCNGWDFVNNDNDPTDDNAQGHGTHVSGIIGAVGNNSQGVAGVSWQISLMPLKILDSAGGGTVADEIQAIQYAVLNGADVINSSLGGDNGVSEFEKEAIEQAGQAGVVFVAAAGNNGTDNDTNAYYPASHPIPNIISVASSRIDDGLSLFSNYGSSSVHLAAPGEDIYNTLPWDSYGFMSGTSMSTPFVSGTIALLIANSPSLSALEAREIIFSSVDPKGYNLITGGRLNANNALNSDINAISPVKPTRLKVLAVTTGTISFEWVDNSNVEDGFIIERKDPGGSFGQIATAGVNVKSFSDSGLAEGTTYYYRVYAYNANGSSQYSNALAITTRIVRPARESRYYEDDSDDKWCFIATAAFGSPLAPEVKVLRRFRDGFLLKSGSGRKIVKFYYRHSPPLARYISEHSLLSLATRAALTPFVYGIKYPFAGVTLALFALGTILYRRNKRRKESSH
jgi:hypothetical protein